MALGRLTQMEVNWLDCLERSVLDTTQPFTPSQGITAMAQTESKKKGRRMLRLPTSRKLSQILRVSKDYIELDTKKEITTARYWVRI